MQYPWSKGVVEWWEGEAICLSLVFTWDTDPAYQRAVWWRSQGVPVRVGGPGVFVKQMAERFRDIAEVGGDIPDAVRYHNPQATFASKGCPVGCSFCIVPAMEGRTFTLLPEFEPRPILCDNNLSALPADYQDYIVERYQQAGVPLLDANSGFEPETFDEEVWRRWAVVNRGPWRFAYDESGEREAVVRVARMLKDVAANRKRTYVLIGNEPYQACMDRIEEVLSLGCEPHVQPVMKLNATQKRPWVRYDWSERLLRDVARWANRRVWRGKNGQRIPFSEYRAGIRTRRPEQVEVLL